MYLGTNPVHTVINKGHLWRPGSSSRRRSYNAPRRRALQAWGPTNPLQTWPAGPGRGFSTTCNPCRAFSLTCSSLSMHIRISTLSYAFSCFSAPALPCSMLLVTGYIPPAPPVRCHHARRDRSSLFVSSYMAPSILQWFCGHGSKSTKGLLPVTRKRCGRGTYILTSSWNRMRLGFGTTSCTIR
jgi:hypothetical protein